MRPTGVYIDTNLLVLLVVGITDRALITKHKRLKSFTVEDYDLLAKMVGRTKVFVTPNTLTEASNLLGQHREPERSQLFTMLQLLIERGFEETVIDSVDAARNRRFQKLGLTDAALLEVVSPETPLLTVDFDLYIAASENGDGAAFNFTWFQFPELTR